MNNDRTPVLLTVLLTSLCMWNNIFSYDNPHFYRATNLFFEPRYDRPWLSSFDVSLGTGSTKCALNRCNKKVPLLDIYGPNNMHELGINVPFKDPSNPLDLIVIQLGLTAAAENFGVFSLGGTFHCNEFIFSWIQNYDKGIFTQVYIPYRHLTIDDLCLCDISPCSCPCPNKYSPIWIAFKNNFDAILARHDLIFAPFDKKGIGDATFLLGWSHSYGQSDVIDYVDTNLRVGVITPTAQQQNPNLVISLPLGYNGHWGFPFIFDFGFGTRGWLTLGLHMDAIIFANKERDVRVNTSPNQSGIIKLTKARVTEEMGAIWTIGAYAKADHFCRGLSVLAGYTFANKNNDFLTPVCGTRCVGLNVNCDEALFGWKMHTVHFWAELDFTPPRSSWGPRLAFFYNLVIGGNRIFKTNMVGGIAGIDLGWYM